MNHMYDAGLDIFNPEYDGQPNILVVGAGGIGSTTVYGLCKMGLKNITLIDYDIIEERNISSQLYKLSDLGKLKVEALRDNVKEFTGVEIKTINGKFRPEHVKDMDIVIMGVDSMDVRKEIASSIQDMKTICIDARMKGEFFVVYKFVPAFELGIYLKDWYPDSESDQTKCTEKAVSYNGLAIASVLTRIVKGLIKGDKNIVNGYNRQVDLHNLLIG